MILGILTSGLTIKAEDRYEKNMPLFWILRMLVIASVCLAIWSDIISVEMGLGYFLGLLSCEAAAAAYFELQTRRRKKRKEYSYENSIPPRFFVTGDKHRNFQNVKKFCRAMETKATDVLILLGDAGLNYYGDSRDDKLKSEVSKLNITLFCLHGNKENRPQNVGTYGIRNFFGGRVYYEPQYPNLCFAIDGEIYCFEGKKYMVVGGAHSVDKYKCLVENKPFWEDEMPDDATRHRVEQRLQAEGNTVFGMLTHTCPVRYLPTEMFLSTRQNAAKKRKPQAPKGKTAFRPDIDRSTEEWLEDIEQKLDYSVWLCGHYHIDKQIDKIHMMYHEILPLHRCTKENGR